jgi:hypothetical protein
MHSYSNTGAAAIKQPVRRRRLLAAALAAAPALVALAGCTSVPVSTMWRLRSFGADELLALDPNALRAAVQSDPRVRFARVDINIVAQAKSGAEDRYKIRLDSQQQVDARLERPAADRRWTVFALDAAGIKAFNELRQTIARLRGQGGSLSLGVSAQESELPPELATRLPLRLDLLLDPKDGWFTLFRETEIDTTRSKGRRG